MVAMNGIVTVSNLVNLSCLAIHIHVFLVACPNGYPCKNGQCTNFVTDRCDGSTECADGSDEENCPGKRYNNTVIIIMVQLIMA